MTDINKSLNVAEFYFWKREEEGRQGRREEDKKGGREAGREEKNTHNSYLSPRNGGKIKWSRLY